VFHRQLLRSVLGKVEFSRPSCQSIFASLLCTYLFDLVSRVRIGYRSDVKSPYATTVTPIPVCCGYTGAKFR